MKLTKEEENQSEAKRRAIAQQTAIRFMGSPRGQYIIGQALYFAIQEMEKAPKPHREESNIADMKYLRDELYPMFSVIIMATHGGNT